MKNEITGKNGRSNRGKTDARQLHQPRHRVPRESNPRSVSRLHAWHINLRVVLRVSRHKTHVAAAVCAQHVVHARVKETLVTLYRLHVSYVYVTDKTRNLNKSSFNQTKFELSN